MDVIVIVAPADAITYEQLLVLMSHGAVRLEAVYMPTDLVTAEHVPRVSVRDEILRLSHEVLLADGLRSQMGSDLITPMREVVEAPHQAWSRRPPRVRVPDSQVRGHIHPRFRRP